MCEKNACVGGAGGGGGGGGGRAESRRSLDRAAVPRLAKAFCPTRKPVPRGSARRARGRRCGETGERKQLKVPSQNLVNLFSGVHHDRILCAGEQPRQHALQAASRGRARRLPNPGCLISATASAPQVCAQVPAARPSALCLLPAVKPSAGVCAPCSLTAAALWNPYNPLPSSHPSQPAPLPSQNPVPHPTCSVAMVRE